MKLPNVPHGSIVLTPAEARMLYQPCRIRELRSKVRTGDTALYDLLTELSICAYTANAEVGIDPRHPAASEEREWWTTENLARGSGRAGRTIRKDIATGDLRATRTTNGWLIRASDAQAYIEGHHRK